jgi:Meiotically up-regulated gene 113
MLLKDLSMASYVYLIRADGTDRYKIGKTDRHPETRLKELNRQQSAYPLLLEYYVEVPDSAVAESHFHQRYQRYRQHGEWFELSRSIDRSPSKWCRISKATSPVSAVALVSLSLKRNLKKSAALVANLRLRQSPSFY